MKKKVKWREDKIRRSEEGTNRKLWGGIESKEKLIAAKRAKRRKQNGKEANNL